MCCDRSGLCDELITRAEESHRSVFVCSRDLDNEVARVELSDDRKKKFSFLTHKTAASILEDTSTK